MSEKTKFRLTCAVIYVYAIIFSVGIGYVIAEIIKEAIQWLTSK